MISSTVHIILLCFTCNSIFSFTDYMSCNFECGMCWWKQDKSKDKFDWIRQVGSTPSFYTGPSYDHTTAKSELLSICFHFWTCCKSIRQGNTIMEGNHDSANLIYRHLVILPKINYTYTRAVTIFYEVELGWRLQNNSRHCIFKSIIYSIITLWQKSGGWGMLPPSLCLLWHCIPVSYYLKPSRHLIFALPANAAKMTAICKRPTMLRCFDTLSLSLLLLSSA